MARNSVRWSGTTSHLLASGTPLWSSSRRTASHLTSLTILGNISTVLAFVPPSASLTLNFLFLHLRPLAPSRLDVLECTSAHYRSYRFALGSACSHVRMYAYAIQDVPKSPGPASTTDSVQNGKFNFTQILAFDKNVV